MKTKAIVATLLVAAAASVDARFAWPYPPKAVSPDESGHWIAINGNPWSHDVESELTKHWQKNFKFPKMSIFERLRK
jgi:hypothetical protein